MIIIGTSGAVNPVNSFPQKMKENRGTVIEINISDKAVFKEADLFIQGKADDVLPLLVNRILED
jgi:NAD-dependent SIR2 family protein deacetylase